MWKRLKDEATEPELWSLEDVNWMPDALELFVERGRRGLWTGHAELAGKFLCRTAADGAYVRRKDAQQSLMKAAADALKDLAVMLLLEAKL